MFQESPCSPCSKPPKLCKSEHFLSCCRKTHWITVVYAFWTLGILSKSYLCSTTLLFVIVLLALVEALQTENLLAAGAQDVFKSPLFMSCWGWPSVFSSPGETESVCSLTMFVSLFLISLMYEDIVSTQLLFYLSVIIADKAIIFLLVFLPLIAGQFRDTWNIHEYINIILLWYTSHWNIWNLFLFICLNKFQMFKNVI